KELLKREIPTIAIVRNSKKLEDLAPSPHLEIVQAEVTQSESLSGILEGVEVLISTVGITRQQDGLSYMEVDYQANLNLLDEAHKSGVKKFIYVSAIGGQKYRDLKIFEAKEGFVDALKRSGMDYQILRPNGFFSDMEYYLQAAEKGNIFLFGKGDQKLNPIHGADLAEVVVDAIDSNLKEIEVGGPELFSQQEIAELALATYQKPSRIRHLPDWLRRVTIRFMRTFTKAKVYGPIEFFLTLMAEDQVAPKYGQHRLKDFFEANRKY
ncbi:MAG: SDR family oxidoreductase, partial [Bacteroidota bacterium]